MEVDLNFEKYKELCSLCELYNHHATDCNKIVAEPHVASKVLLKLVVAHLDQGAHAHFISVDFGYRSFRAFAGDDDVRLELCHRRLAWF